MLVWHGHGAKVRALAFGPDGRYLASTAGQSRFVWLWEPHTGKLVRKLRGSVFAARALAFLPDGRHVAGLHERYDITVWDADTGAVAATLRTGGFNLCDALAPRPDGSALVSFIHPRFAEWDEPARPEPAPRPPDRQPGPSVAPYLPFVFGFSPGGRYFWRTGGELALLAPNMVTPLRRLEDPDGASASGCAFTPDDARVCVQFGHRAVVWRLDEPHAPPVKLRGHKGQMRAVGFLPGGGTVLTAAMDGTCRLWDANTGAELRSFDWGIGKVRVAAVSADGALCAAGGDDGRLVVWDADQ